MCAPCKLRSAARRGARSMIDLFIEVTAMIPFQSFARRFASVAACALGIVLAGAAAAATPYPDKPIRLLVPYPPGGITDVLTRSLAELLRKELGQPVIVDNKPGANTALAAQALATSPADGYTV